MMTATFAPPSLPTSAGDPDRILPITVNLLPEEVITARATRKARRGAVAIMAVVAVAIGGWYYTARQSASDAQSDLDAAKHQNSSQIGGQSKYAEVTKTKLGITTTRGQLAAATGGDIAWYKVLSSIRTALPAGVTLTGITGSASTASQVPAASSTPSSGSSGSSSSGTGSTTPSQTPAQPAVVLPPGTVLLTGKARTKDEVSRFSNNLARVSGVASPFVTGVQRNEEGQGVTFNLQLIVTKQALSSRYSKAGK